MMSRFTKASGIILPCNGCTACCQRDLVVLDPRYDDARKYEIELNNNFSQPVVCLKHKADGDCWYLDRDAGCTIWQRRPQHCRTLDCRVFLKLDTEKLIARGILSREVVEAARELDHRMRKASRAEKTTNREQWKVPGRKATRRFRKA